MQVANEIIVTFTNLTHVVTFVILGSPMDSQGPPEDPGYLSFHVEKVLASQPFSLAHTAQFVSLEAKILLSFISDEKISSMSVIEAHRRRQKSLLYFPHKASFHR